MSKDAETVVCAGCGATTTRDALTGWKLTDVPWCPKCGWLA